jgi:hypothetical protein
MKTNVNDDLLSVLNGAISAAGRAKVMATLKQLGDNSVPEPFTLTIIVNAGVHHLSEEYLKGEVFVASEGSLDLSSTEAIHIEFRHILLRIARELKSRAWSRVYIVPFGPTPLSMQVKLLVYRICGIESIDVMNVPGKPRVDLYFDLRQLIVESDLPDTVPERQSKS